MRNSSRFRSISGAFARLCGILVLGLALSACQSASLSGSGLGLSPSQTLGLAEVRAPSTLVIDASTGRTLYAEEADGLRYPASLSKLMTLYLLFEDIGAGKVSLNDEFVVTDNAASKPPAKIGLKPGETIRVRDAAQAIAVKSANDVATAIAENLAGSEQAFAARMTAKARSLGMRRTNFVNASGLPDPQQISTARDMATLAMALRARFPQFLPLFSVEEFVYRGRTYKATNKLLGKVAGVDGMKTGYIRDAGFHLIASAQRGGRRIIVVVMGGDTGRERDEKVKALIAEYLGPDMAAR